MRQIDRIRKSSDTFGPSSFEDAVVAYAQEEVCEICTCRENHMRNLCMNLKRDSQGGVNIMLDAHSDKVGFIVQVVKSNGFLRFLPLGGQDVKNITANKALIKNRDGKLIPGIVCSRPVRLMNVPEQGKALDFVDVLTGVGAASTQEVQGSFHIGTGAPIIPDATCTYNEEHKAFMGKALDNRIGCAVAVETFCRPYGRTLTNTVSVTLPSQGEIGERGMTCMMNDTGPDVVICFEGCPADDSFGEEYVVQSALKKGSMSRYFGCSMITSLRLQRFALELAHADDIPVQESVRKEGGTNGGITHTVQFGIPTTIINTPTRYAHSSCGILAYQGYEHTVKLVTQIIEGLSKDIAESF